MKCLTAGFLEEFPHHAIWKVIQELHMIRKLFAPVVSFHIPSDLHRIRIGNAIQSTVLLYWPKHLLGTNTGACHTSHSICDETDKERTTNQRKTCAQNSEPAFSRCFEIHCQPQRRRRQFGQCPLQAPGVLPAKGHGVQFFFSYPSFFSVTNSEP